VRTEDDLRRSLADAAQRAAAGTPEARARVGRLVRRQRAWRVGAVAGVVVALAAFGIVSITRPDHRASLRVVSPGPSPSPSAVPGPEPDTESSQPTAADSRAVPAGFVATSVTFVSPKDGFVLGRAHCATDPHGCTAIVRTSDNGKTWKSVNAPADVGSTPYASPKIRFATVNDGWLVGSEVWSTHDGGDTWVRVQLDAAATGTVIDLAASAGTVHVVTLRQAGDQFRYEIWSSPVGHDDWYRSPTTIPKGAAPVQDGQLVLHGGDGWVLLNERTVYAGAELHDRKWSLWKPPCADRGGPATLAASTSRDLVAVCQEGQWGGPPPQTRLHVSHDGGATFTPGDAPLPQSAGEPATPRPNTVALASSDGETAAIRASFDGAKTWSVVYRAPKFTHLFELGFTTATQGIAIASSSDGATGELIMTTDGGHHWRVVPFRSSA
jgi:photosystem II stability/assembly factor-like uncharacterized protein